MKRVHPMTALACWLGIALCATLLAFAWVVASGTTPSHAQLNAAHLAGVELGNNMCVSFRDELGRNQARSAARAPALGSAKRGML